MSEPTLTLIPHLICADAHAAINFYERAFGAKTLCKLSSPDGKVMHSALQLGNSTIYLVDEYLEHGSKGAKTLGGSPVMLHLQVSNCDEVFEKAVAAGCTPTMPLEDMFWGDRYGQVVDPFGHCWSIATTVREVPMEELAKAGFGTLG